MKIVKIFQYYAFGHDYKILLNHSEEDTYADFFGRLKDFSEFVDGLGLPVTKSCMDIKGFNKEYRKLEKVLKDTPDKGKETVTNEYHTKFIAIIQLIDATLDAEIHTKIAFIPDAKRHSFEYLTETIELLFSENIFSLLPQIATYDFQESGKCLAFDRYTASSFHALRGTEDVLKFYYQKLLGLIPKESMTWYDFANEIEKAIKSKKITPAPPGDLMSNLDSLRKYYRNKTQHPQLMYSSDEAQDLLSSCIKCVNQIMADLKKRGLI
ncbi:MAG: hypothetical protein IPG95_13520 [Saprospiraceae bacterium]|nr:hypothetical protein [Saprospiraceae bacterium]